MPSARVVNNLISSFYGVVRPLGVKIRAIGLLIIHLSHGGRLPVSLLVKSCSAWERIL